LDVPDFSYFDRSIHILCHPPHNFEQFVRWHFSRSTKWRWLGLSKNVKIRIAINIDQLIAANKFSTYNLEYYNMQKMLIKVQV